MTGNDWGAVSSEQQAVLDLVDRIGAGWRPRDPDARGGIAAARRELADSGLWALGLPEFAGGGGADRLTTQLAIARVASYWPALGLATAHLHAAGFALTAGGRPEVAAAAAEAARPVAVVEGTESADGDLIRVDRIDVGASTCDLVLLRGPRC
jgi:alkylation response protein AidB-like acyl-CoA dehydrogenase